MENAWGLCLGYMTPLHYSMYISKLIIYILFLV